MERIWRSIPDKVTSRIDSQDILIALFTQGDATWIMTEAAYAKGQGKYVVLLAEGQPPNNRGILGQDLENIVFPEGNVEKAFTDLLYALPTV